MSQILLHPSEHRCATGGKGCTMQHRCARAKAPAAGHPVVDYTGTDGANTAICAGFYNFANAREKAGELFAAAAKARIRGRA